MTTKPDAGMTSPDEKAMTLTSLAPAASR